MSLFSHPPHEITVYPVVDVDDGYGGTQPGEGIPVTVRALIQPLAARDDSGAIVGYPAEELYQVVARSLPGGSWSRVTWNGDDFVIVGEPRRYSASASTNHHIATIRKR